MRSKTVIALALLFMELHSSGLGLTTKSDWARKVQSNASSQHDKYLFQIGNILGEGLARNYSIFVGRVASVNPASAVRQETSKDSVEVLLIVTDWLWNKPQSDGSALRLQKFPTHQTTPWVTAAPSPDGKTITPVVGEELLVISKSRGETDSTGETIINNYLMVSDDQRVFPDARRVIADHARYLESSSEISPAELDTKHLVFCGYLATYLWRAAKPERYNSDAIALSSLLQNEKIPSNGWIQIRMRLKAILIQTNFTLSQKSRAVVIENLVKAGSSENLILAQQGITLLLALSDSKRDDLRPYLDPNRAVAISRNYRTLTSTGAIKGTHRLFESQLGW
jgi:hypothetical protein